MKAAVETSPLPPESEDVEDPHAKDFIANVIVTPKSILDVADKVGFIVRMHDFPIGFGWDCDCDCLFSSWLFSCLFIFYLSFQFVYFVGVYQ